MTVAGIPQKYSWDRKKAVFSFRFYSNPKVEAPTEIFLPSAWFADNPFVSAKKSAGGSNGSHDSDGSLRTEYCRAEQRLKVYNNGYEGEAVIGVYVVSVPEE
jgi:hypothetical protein